MRMLRRQYVGRITRGARRAFTLVELLVVIGIIALLMSVLMPALNGVRRQAQATECMANVRQVCQALITYATDNQGKFPPNFGMAPAAIFPRPSPAQFWYDMDRAGKLLRGPGMSPPGMPLPKDIRGRAVTCPADEDGTRSYSMNIWASSAIEDHIMKSGHGKPWKQSVRNADRMILVAERWSGAGSIKRPDLGFTAFAHVGYEGMTPGQRFGAGGGLSPQVGEGRFGWVNCTLPYVRHRPAGMSAGPLEPVGRVTIGYADGHVALKSNTQLGNPATGLSTLDSWWSPIDDELNK